MYEHFEHTADLGLRVRAPDLDTLFAEAALALTAAIVEDVTTIEPREEVELIVTGNDTAYRMVDWLTSVLIEFETEHWLFREFRVKNRPTGLTATCRGEPFDPVRHPLSHEVKAITYHGLVVEPADGGWLAEVIVDI
jgi:SHS2 domain-containing protein